MSLIYDKYLVNVHFGNILHSFIPHFTLHSAEKIRIEFSANYPLTTSCNPHSAKYPFPFSYPLRILKTCIKSPVSLHVSSVVKPSIFSLFSHPISDKPEINFVSFLYPF